MSLNNQTLWNPVEMFQKTLQMGFCPLRLLTIGITIIKSVVLSTEPNKLHRLSLVRFLVRILRQRQCVQCCALGQGTLSSLPSPSEGA